jgi:hypothetical protein
VREAGLAEVKEELIAMYATVRRYVGNAALADQLADRSDEVKALIVIQTGA